MLCGKNEAASRSFASTATVTMNGDAKKKTYTGNAVPDPRAAPGHRRSTCKAVMEKMKSCPTPCGRTPAPPDVDTSKCQMTPPTSSVVNAGDTASFAGHAAHHTILTMTQSCANPETGDSCDMAYTFDLWLANEDLPETGHAPDLRPRITCTRWGWMTPGAMASAGAIQPVPCALQGCHDRNWAAIPSSLKGYPLKTTFRFAFGGPHCASAKDGGGSSAGASSGGSRAECWSPTPAARRAGAAASSSRECGGAQAASEAMSHSTGSGAGGVHRRIRPPVRLPTR